MTPAQVISCSRRTDIPRCYPGWLDEKLAAGGLTFKAPRGAVRSVSLSAEAVHSLVLWSKDYGPLFRRRLLIRRLHGFNPFFHFTITGLGESAWESGIPGWKQTMLQMKEIVNEFGAARVNWRFDPVLFWRENGRLRSNLPLFTRLGAAAADLGITGCTFSFAHWYNKSQRRANRGGVPFADPGPEEKLAAVRILADEAEGLGLRLASCSNDSWLAVPGIAKARCIDASLLGGLRDDGRPASTAKDRAQRAACGCTRSIDIGSYAQRCPGAQCLYCYAN